MAIEKKTFSDLFSDSWKELKENFKAYAVIIFLLSFIPSVIMYALLFVLGYNAGSLIENPSFSEIAPVIIPFFIIMIIIIFLSIWMHASLVYNSFYKKKTMNIRESLKGGIKYFWKYFLLYILIGIIIIGIIGILIIIGIIIYALLKFNPVAVIIFIVLFFIFMAAVILYVIWLAVSWVFSIYVLIGENKGIIDSLKSSKKLVKGKWWKTFGYILLIGIILGVISAVISIPGLIINYILNPNIFSQTASIEPNVLIATESVSLIFNFLASLIAVPLSILFFKNFYLARRKEMKK